MILNLATDDYANYSHSIAKSLRLIGLDCVDVCERRHRNKYQSESTEMGLRDMIPLIRKADVIQVMHSDIRLFELSKQYGRGKIIVYHTGSRYREKHLMYEEIFNGVTSVTDQTEFMCLGNHHYVVSPVELPAAPMYSGGKIKIGHYPSTPSVKGTSEIIQMLKPFDGQFEWLHSTTLVPHHEQLKRISECDIYIELFKPELNGKPYGCFGVTALEAASMGKVVITNNLFPDVYRKAYGDSPMIFANDPEQFKRTIEVLLGTSNIAQAFQRDAFNKARQNHSFQATGNRVAKIIYETTES